MFGEEIGGRSEVFEAEVNEVRDVDGFRGGTTYPGGGRGQVSDAQ